MLCAKYDYKMDIAVKKEEAFQDGKEAGAQQKAIEDAVIAVTKFHVPIDDVAREYNIDKELIESNLNP